MQSHNKNKRILATCLLTAMVATGILLYSFTNLGNPVSYYLGGLLLKQGQYNLAAQIYADLGTYQSSESLYQETRYRQAGNYYRIGQYETARTLYAKLEDYKKSRENYNLSTYSLAKHFYEHKKFGKAKELFASIPDYKDAKNQADECQYQAAYRAYQGKDYLSAWIQFATLNYKDSETLSQQCKKNMRFLTPNGFFERFQKFYLDGIGYVAEPVATASSNQKEYRITSRKQSELFSLNLQMSLGANHFIRTLKIPAAKDTAKRMEEKDYLDFLTYVIYTCDPTLSVAEAKEVAEDSQTAKTVRNKIRYEQRKDAFQIKFPRKK